MAALTVAASTTARPAEKGFVSLFNGRDLEGWTLVNPSGRGYVVQDGLLICPADGGGNLFTTAEYSDFVLRFEFRLEPGSNNGIGIRSPLAGDASRSGMEVQVLDDSAEQYRDLRPAQYHGSIYSVVPAKRGALKPPGAWNREEIRCEGRRVRVTLNGRVTVDADLDEVTDLAVLREHPGIMRERGHIGFLGHGTTVAFRNIRLRDLAAVSGTQDAGNDNRPPKGFRALFNGRDLSGWKGLVADPPKRARMSSEELAAAQSQADQQMREHWKVADDALVYDGKGNSLCTARDYGDFELLVDWKIHPGGDSGIYLRGSPQVQIWDRPEGSGGLYNNQKNPSQPSKKADRPPGEWNRFRIRMIGDKVTVFLNGELVVDNVTMENYWERDKPIYPTGAIELQHHGDTLYFKNIYVRELGTASRVSASDGVSARGQERSDARGRAAGAAVGRTN
jgi:hypothetical protein